MYRPDFTRIDDPAEVAAALAAVEAAEFVTVDADGYPAATLVPIIGDTTLVVAHLSRFNPQAEHLVAVGAEVPALLVASAAQGYISPSWYASKAEHGRVVPTWNYLAVQVRGRARAITDPDRLREIVEQLTQRHEAPRAEPWAVADAPDAWVRGRLRAIVGIELRVESVEVKAKLSQNRDAADQAGVWAGLSADAAPGTADLRAAMAARGATPAN